MIAYYSIENFKSIKIKQSISFIARKVKSDRLVLNGNILPVISIYGPNGGGKSSILESMIFIVNIIRARNDNLLLSQQIGILSILKNKSEIDNKETKWNFGFVTKKDIFYEYEIWIDHQGISFEKLLKREGLKSKNKMEVVFERNNNEIKASKNIKNTKVILDNVSGSLLSYLGSIINDEDINNVYNSFNKIIAFNSNIFNPVSFDITARTLYNFDLEIIKKEKSKILKILSDIDINIIDINIVSQPIGGEIIFLKKQSPNGEIEIPFDLESDGTKKIIQLLCYIIKHIHNGSLFCVDEFDSQLHTKLLGYIIDLFNSNLNTNSQIIFTSHDMATLDNRYFRKDEIYFAALNELYYTDVVCLSDFGDVVREKTSISNKYLNGDFGYDPYIKKCESWD